jgi:signal transduction histidine kinase
VTVVALMTAVVAAASLRITDRFDPTLVAGPMGMAVVTVLAYRALEQEARARQRLVDHLSAAQAELAAAQHHAGVLAERTRLSRDLHDSLGQGLSSINLLLNAAEQGWDRRPADARQHVRTAAATARDGLEDVRRVVRDLAPTGLDLAHSPDPLVDALRTVVERSAVGVDVALRVDGPPRALPDAVPGALLQCARGALANVLEHARATRVVVTLTYLPGEVILDVRDDGVGFDPATSGRRGARGHGLPGRQDRIAALGGRLTVESAPGEGTSLSVVLPAPPRL